MKVFLGVVTTLLAVILLIAIGLGIQAIFFPVNTIQKSIDTAYEVTNKTMTGENAIYNYEYFKSQEESISALYKKEARAKEEVESFKKLYGNPAKWGMEEKNEYARLNTVATGLGNQLDDAIADYNAKSKMVNRSIFKDNLPSNITRAFYTGQQLTK
jgi:hypothetical protein